MIALREMRDTAESSIVQRSRIVYRITAEADDATSVAEVAPLHGVSSRLTCQRTHCPDDALAIGGMKARELIDQRLQ